MDQRVYIARLHMEHYWQQLAGEVEGSKGLTIRRLTLEAEARLAVLERPAREWKA